MKLLYIYAFLIFASKIAVADNFNDLWKKHGGEVLSGNKTNSITKDVDTYRLNKAEREAEILRKKIKELEQNQIRKNVNIENDTSIPNIKILSNQTIGKQGIINGNVQDNFGIAELLINNKPVAFDNNGDFEFSSYVPSSGKEIKIKVIDLAGLSASTTIKLIPDRKQISTAIIFDDLNPLNKSVKVNKNAIALIIGIANYENATKALFADNDALVFKDYASEKLGVPENRIKVLLNEEAEYAEILLTAKKWLKRLTKKHKSDIYIFFAGHGLASNDGEQIYLLPFDGRVKLLDDTALVRNRLFNEIQQANPKSVTVFLDTCYSGKTRSEETLIASRPVEIKAKKQSVPNGFTLFSAAGADETSNPLYEAKHGIFSYFLMKGMEGKADINNDNQITANELHYYLKENVAQHSDDEQTPELQGDKDRVLVQFK